MILEYMRGLRGLSNTGEMTKTMESNTFLLSEAGPLFSKACSSILLEMEQLSKLLPEMKIGPTCYQISETRSLLRPPRL